MLVSAFVDSGATHSFVSKPSVKKLNIPLVLGIKLALTLADGSMLTCEEEVDAAYGIISKDANQVSE